MVLGKAAAFGVLMYLAALNKGRYAPGVAAGDERAARSFRRTVAAEWSVLVVVLVTTRVMTALYAPEHLEGAFGSHGHCDRPSHLQRARLPDKTLADGAMRT